MARKKSFIIFLLGLSVGAVCQSQDSHVVVLVKNIIRCKVGLYGCEAPYLFVFERKAKTYRERGTDVQTDRWTDRETDGRTNQLAHKRKWTYGKNDRQTDR